MIRPLAEVEREAIVAAVLEAGCTLAAAKAQREGMLVDLIADGAHLPEAWAGTVDYFVLHHVLEHFGCGEAAGLIKEAYRVLKPGGSLLIFIPDIEALAMRWLENKIDDYIYIVNLMGAYHGSEEDRHRWHYTVGSLNRFLGENAPWSVQKPFDWRLIPGSDCAKDWWILAREVVK